MASHDPTTPPSTPVTRRTLALGAGAFSAIGLTAGAAASVAGAAQQPDAGAELSPPMRECWSRLVALTPLAEEAHAKASNLRDLLVARWGEPCRTRPRVSAEALWGHDPEYGPLPFLNDESNRMMNEVCDQQDALLALPARSLADLVCKLAVVASLWAQEKTLDEHGEYHELIARDLFAEAVRVLQPLLPPGADALLERA